MFRRWSTSNQIGLGFGRRIESSMFNHRCCRHRRPTMTRSCRHHIYNGTGIRNVFRKAFPNGWKRESIRLFPIGTFDSRHPILFGATVSAIKTGFSDWFVQRYLEKKSPEEISWKRVSMFTLFGWIYLGYVQYFVYVPIFSRVVRSRFSPRFQRIFFSYTHTCGVDQISDSSFFDTFSLPRRLDRAAVSDGRTIRTIAVEGKTQRSCGSNSRSQTSRIGFAHT